MKRHGRHRHASRSHTSLDIPAVRSVCRLHQTQQPLCKDPVPVLSGVLEAHGRSCRRISQSGHEFGQGAHRGGGENRAGVTKIVNGGDHQAFVGEPNHLSMYRVSNGHRWMQVADSLGRAASGQRRLGQVRPL